MEKKLILLGMLTVFGSVAFAQNPQQHASNQVHGPTYNWIVPDMKTNQNPMYANSFSRHQVQTAFDIALANRGMTRNTKNPDYLLQFHTYTQRVRRNYMGGGGYGYPMMMGFGRYGWGMPYGGFGYGGYGGYPCSSTSTDGTLILDIVDTKTGDIIWQKAISGDVSNPNKLDKAINKGVKKLMKQFPAIAGR